MLVDPGASGVDQHFGTNIEDTAIHYVAGFGHPGIAFAFGPQRFDVVGRHGTVVKGMAYEVKYEASVVIMQVSI